MAGIEQKSAVIDVFTNASDVHLFKKFSNWCRLHVTCTILVDSKRPLHATMVPFWILRSQIPVVNLHVLLIENYVNGLL